MPNVKVPEEEKKKVEADDKKGQDEGTDDLDAMIRQLNLITLK